jgi:hypothetical protein
MKTTQALTTNAVLVAQLLERLEHGGHPDAGQYRLVAERLGQELARIDDIDALNRVLEAHPSAAEVYENMNYQHAGLSRSRLDASVTAELKAREAIACAMKPTTAGLAQGPAEGGSASAG